MCCSFQCSLKSGEKCGLNPHSLARRIFITVFLVNVLYVHSYLGNPMSKSMLDLTVSLVDRRTLDIDPYAGNSADVASRGGHFYSGMPPGVSVVCVPYYLLAKTWLWTVATPEREEAVDDRAHNQAPTSAAWRASEKHFTIILLNLFICVFGFSALAGAMAVLFHRALVDLYPDLGERRRLVTTWLFSFATLWFVYSPAIYHRVFSTFLCFGAFLLVLPPKGMPFDRAPFANELPPQDWLRRRGLLFGLALGLAIASTYEIAIVAGVLILYALVRWKDLWAWGWTVAGAACLLVPLAVYHTICFGAPWATPYGARITASVVPPLFQGEGWTHVLEWKRAVAFLIGSKYGVFFYSPLLFLSMPAVARLRGGDPYRHIAALAFGVFLSLLVFHYVTGYNGLPGEFGFRMMLPAIPFLMLLVPLSYRWSYRRVVPILTVLSAVILGKGVMYGIHAGRPFWTDYPDFIRTYGFSNYTLANLKDHVWPILSPWRISLIHLAALGLIALLLWRFVWMRREMDNQ